MDNNILNVLCHFCNIDKNASLKQIPWWTWSRFWLALNLMQNLQGSSLIILIPINWLLLGLFYNLLSWLFVKKVDCLQSYCQCQLLQKKTNILNIDSYMNNAWKKMIFYSLNAFSFSMHVQLKQLSSLNCHSI